MKFSVQILHTSKFTHKTYCIENTVSFNWKKIWVNPVDVLFTAVNIYIIFIVLKMYFFADFDYFFLLCLSIKNEEMLFKE